MPNRNVVLEYRSPSTGEWEIDLNFNTTQVGAVQTLEHARRVEENGEDIVRIPFRVTVGDELLGFDGEVLFYQDGAELDEMLTSGWGYGPAVDRSQEEVEPGPPFISDTWVVGDAIVGRGLDAGFNATNWEQGPGSTFEMIWFRRFGEDPPVDVENDRDELSYVLTAADEGAYMTFQLTLISPLGSYTETTLTALGPVEPAPVIEEPVEPQPEEPIVEEPEPI